MNINNASAIYIKQIYIISIIYQQHMIRVIFFTIIVLLTYQIPVEDQVIDPPGQINQTIYSGYLSTAQANRFIHYVFVKVDSKPDSEKVPLTLWFNGGPGCSSLIGMLQQIGPYLVPNSYKQKDPLIKNQYAWNKHSNMLFLQSPAIVGFSSDNDTSFHYDDKQTANDAFQAIKDFLFNKAPQFANRSLYISGESYAGKYIPDITDLILENNRMTGTKYINIKGILVGNGVMNFQRDSLTRSSMQYLGEHEFLSERIHSIYRNSCNMDFNSPRCKYVRYEFQILRNKINPYNVFEICQNIGSTQALKLLQHILKSSNEFDSLSNLENPVLQDINQCPSDQGAISYWNINKEAYKVTKYNKVWAPCSNLLYTRTPYGSMEQYYRIFLNKGVKVWLFNGDWDDVVPFTDTEKNLAILNKKISKWEPWFYNDKHAGFFVQINTLTLITVKAAGHMVPQDKPRQAQQMFYNFINDRPINSTIPI